MLGYVGRKVYSGSGVAHFVHYTDGRWILKDVDFESGLNSVSIDNIDIQAVPEEKVEREKKLSAVDSTRSPAVAPGEDDLQGDGNASQKTAASTDADQAEGEANRAAVERIRQHQATPESEQPAMPKVDFPAQAGAKAAGGSIQTAPSAAQSNGSFLSFRGAWFDITYPAGFQVVPRDAPQSTPGPEPDGVSFVSPDGAVEFYVYSPQWQGESMWLKPGAGEVVASRSSQKAKSANIDYLTFHGPGSGC